MKKVCMLLVGLLCISLSALAGEVITNDTGEDTTGLHVVFSAPVLIMGFGDTLMNVDQRGLSYEFVFSGGTVPPWGSHWMNWTPATAQIMSYEWLDQVPILISQTTTDNSMAEEPGLIPGASVSPDSETEAGYIAWSGALTEGQPIEIRVFITSSAYLTWRQIQGKSVPTVHFRVKHRSAEGWGSVIQGVATETLDSPFGYLEEFQLPLEEEEGGWFGSVIIIPCPSLTYLGILRPRGHGAQFGTSIANIVSPVDPNSGKLNPSQRQRALVIHRDAWNEASMKAESDAYFKYAVYASRSLAVKHPEVYLQGDALFIQHVTSNAGYAEAFQEQDPHSDRYYDGFPGPPLNLQHIDPAVFQVVTAKELYPQDAPFYPFVDRRLSPIASYLVTQNRNLTSLEKTSLAYFTSRRDDDELPFIIYCSTGQAYLATEDHLVDTSDGSYVEEPKGAPILIFNESHVWYPLMDRDDTAASPRLQAVVEQFRSERFMPELAPEEEVIVERLKVGTTLTHSERDLAILAAVRGIPWDSRLFEQIARGYLREYPLDIWVGIQLNWLVRANYLSPFAAFLGGILDTANLAQTVEDMVDRWHSGFGFRHGHVWQCGLVRYSIDEIMRIKFVHCVLHAASIAAVLDVAGIDNLLIKACFDDSGSTHTYVSIPSIGYVISNGEITDRETILNDRPDGSQWNTLWYVSSGEKWAFPYIGFYCGTWAPIELARTLEHLEGLYGDAIHGRRSSSSGPRNIHFRVSVIRSEAYIPALKDEQLGWHPIIHP